MTAHGLSRSVVSGKKGNSVSQPQIEKMLRCLTRKENLQINPLVDKTPDNKSA